RARLLCRASPRLSRFLSTPTPPRLHPFPYTTLFRSRTGDRGPHVQRRHAGRGRADEGLDRRPGQGRVRRGRRGRGRGAGEPARRSEEHTSELQSLTKLVCRLLLEKKKKDDSAEALLV